MNSEVFLGALYLAGFRASPFPFPFTPVCHGELRYCPLSMSGFSVVGERRETAPISLDPRINRSRMSFGKGGLFKAVISYNDC